MDFHAQVAERLCSTDRPWAAALEYLAATAGADAAWAVVNGPPPRSLAQLGPLGGGPGPDLLDKVTCSFPVGVVALGVRREPGLTAVARETLDAAAPILRLAMTRESETAARVTLEQRLAAVDKRSTLARLSRDVLHDIGHPLNVLITSVGMMDLQLRRMEMHLVDPRPQELSAIAEMRTLIADVMGHVPLTRRLMLDWKDAMTPDVIPSGAWEFDVADALGATGRMARSYLRHRGELRIYVQADLPPLRGHRNRIEHALINLLMNAVEATQVRATGSALVEASATRRGEQVIIEIADNGHGIAPDVMPRIFDRFFSTKRAEEGTGLGLGIARDAVESLGGRIEVESEPGRGARFRIILPVPARNAPPPPRRRRLLLVEDDDVVRDGLARDLAEAYDVTAVATGDSALIAVEHGAFDVVVASAYLPHMTGDELYGRVRALRPGLEHKIVFGTTGVAGLTVREFLAEVPNARFIKPARVEELLELLAKVDRDAVT